jgi:4-hydroxy-3-methylbut-2-enyl diphosphate reductase
VGQVRIVDGLDGARTVQPTPGKKLVWLSQTTLSVDETLDAVAILKERFPEIQDPPSDDICYATQNRQEAIKAIAPQSDLVIVVGSQNSSNSVRLVEVALEYGAKASYLVDYAEQIQDEWFSGVETIGLTSGASVPEILVTDVLKTLAEHGFSDVETITATEESLLFALPPELRRDMKVAGIQA